MSCEYLRWVHRRNKYGILHNHEGFVCARCAVYEYHVALACIKSLSSTLWQVKVMHYLHKFAFYGCVLRFPGYCIMFSLVLNFSHVVLRKT